MAYHRKEYWPISSYIIDENPMDTTKLHTHISTVATYNTTNTIYTIYTCS